MNIKQQFTTVTRFSKIVALILFVSLPFIGFCLGMQFQQSLSLSPLSPVVILQKSNLQKENASLQAIHDKKGSDIKNYLGKYVLGDGVSSSNNLEIKGLTDNKIKFNSVAGKESCLGELDDSMLIKNQVGYFEKNDCQLEFYFINGEIRVLEKKVCSYYHGSSCSFAGTYIKKDISSWKTYVNNEYGFEFKYPSSWNSKDMSMEGTGNPNLWIHTQNNDESFPMASSPWNMASYFDVKSGKISNTTTLESYVSAKDINKIEIGGVQYDAGVPFDDPFSLTSSSHVSSIIYIINQNKLYMISYSAANIEEYKNNKKNFIDMLSTFKFTH